MWPSRHVPGTLKSLCPVGGALQPQGHHILSGWLKVAAKLGAGQVGASRLRFSLVYPSATGMAWGS